MTKTEKPHDYTQNTNLTKTQGFTRSISAKGCSPDNAAAEGFFCRLKNEMFYRRDWSGVSFAEFTQAISAYIDFYNHKRAKQSLGWLTPMQQRAKLTTTHPQSN